MSYTFSRRAFLKASTALVVAVAASGLLSGCEYTDPNNPVSKELGTEIEISQTVGKLNDINGGEFLFNLKNECDNKIRISPGYFSVTVFDSEGTVIYNCYDCNDITVTWVDKRPQEYPLLLDNESVDLKVTASNFPEVHAGETIVFQYYPYDVSQTWNYSMSWAITQEAAEE